MGRNPFTEDTGYWAGNIYVCPSNEETQLRKSLSNQVELEDLQLESAFRTLMGEDDLEDEICGLEEKIENGWV